MSNLLDQDNKPFRIVGGYDSISCKLIERAGFDGIWASGLCISAIAGHPDANIMGFDTFLSYLRIMRNATNLPIIADCDTGYGDFHNVIFTVKELIKTGISGFCIEDKIFPKINSYSEAKPQLLEKPDVFATKIKAASDIKSNSDFIILARIESLIAGIGINDAIARANLYQQAGADAIVIHSKRDEPGEIIQFLKLWNDKLPVVIIPTAYPSITLTEVKRYSVAGVIYANQILRAAIKSINNYLAELFNAESLSECKQSISSVQEIFDLQKMEEYKAEQDKYEKFQVFLDAMMQN